MWRERSAWMTVVAVLATSLLWLTLLSGIALAASHGLPPGAIAVARALVRVAVALAIRMWPVLPVALLGGMMLALFVRPRRGLNGRVRHV